jgi:hypothetical protein
MYKFRYIEFILQFPVAHPHQSTLCNSTTFPQVQEENYTKKKKKMYLAIARHLVARQAPPGIPPGVNPNDGVHANIQTIIGVSVFTIFLATVSTALRFCSRKVRQLKWELDDWFMLVATVHQIHGNDDDRGGSNDFYIRSLSLPMLHVTLLVSECYRGHSNFRFLTICVIS